MKTRILKLTLCAVTLLWVAPPCFAQTITAMPAPDGIWISTGRALQPGAAVQRREAGGAWEDAGVFAQSDSRSAFEGAYFAAAAAVRTTETISSEKLGLLWDKWSRSRSLDSLGVYRDNLPVLAALGGAWYDAGAAKGVSYEYRTGTGEGPFGEATKSVSFPPAVDARALIRPSMIKPMREGVQLEFEISEPGDMRTAHVYRSYYLRSNAERISPLVTYNRRGDKLYAMFTDFTATPKVLYAYTFVPVDAAGNEGHASEPAKVFHVPPGTIPPSVRHLSANALKGRRAIRVSWLRPATPDVVSVEVYRGRDYVGAYQKIASLAPMDTLFDDYDVAPVDPYYYAVAINGTFELSENTPRVPGFLPAMDANHIPPRGLQVRLDGNVAVLSWQSSAEECRGFYVYRGNNCRDKLVKISGIIARTDGGATYRDTLPAITPPTTYTYAITDENASYAESPQSSRASVQVAPAAGVQSAIVSDVSVVPTEDGKALRVMWTDLRETGNAPITGYRLYRSVRSADGKITEARKELKPGGLRVNFYQDADVAEGATYLYSVAAQTGIADAGVSAETGYTMPVQQPLPVTNIQAFGTDGEVALSWAVPVGMPLQKVFIMRAREGVKAERIASLEPDAASYTDKDVKRGERYYYYFATQAGSGAVSEVTMPVTVRVY